MKITLINFDKLSDKTVVFEFYMVVVFLDGAAT